MNAVSTGQAMGWLAGSVVLAGWALGCAGLAFFGRRFAPGGVFAPVALALILGAASEGFRLGLPLVLGPALFVLALGAAIRGPLHGPRTLWPAALGVLLAGMGVAALGLGALLDGDPVLAATAWLGLGPLGLLASIALVRGAPHGPGPEAGVIGAVAFGHGVGAVGTALSAARPQLGLFGVVPTGWLTVGTLVGLLAAVGMGALAAAAATHTRPRTLGVALGIATLLLWLPLTWLAVPGSP